MADEGVMVMAAIPRGRFFHWPTSDRSTVEANAVRGEVYRQLSERDATGWLAQRPPETMDVEADETSPYWGIALILAMAVGASFWVALIWAVMRVIR